jgi:hypothetical protein
LKLKLEGVRRDDRRVRFANVAVADVGDREEIALVTDSRGCLRYRLVVPAGSSMGLKERRGG